MKTFLKIVLVFMLVLLPACSEGATTVVPIPVAGGINPTDVPTEVPTTEPSATSTATQTSVPPTETQVPSLTPTDEPTPTLTPSVVPTASDDGRVWSESEYWLFWSEVGSNILTDPDYLADDLVYQKVSELLPDYQDCLIRKKSGCNIADLQKLANGGLYPAVLCQWAFNNISKEFGTELAIGDERQDWFSGDLEIFPLYTDTQEMVEHLRYRLGTPGQEPFCSEFVDFGD